MARGVNGLHHITAIAGPAQENVDFYAGILGMHLVKRSVNQDDPGTYHLFYADAEGSPGSDLTFFPWAHMAAPRIGHGLAVETSLEIPAGSLEYWAARLERYGVRFERCETRFGDTEPAGRRHTRISPVARRKRAVEPARRFTPWDGSPVPPERQIRGLYGARLWERSAVATTASSPVLSASSVWATRTDGRGTASAAPPVSSTSAKRRTSGAAAGAWAAVHHLAWRVDDDAHQLAVRDAGRGGRRSRDGRHRSLLVQVGVLQGARRRAVRDRDRRTGVRDRRRPGPSGRGARAAALARGANAGGIEASCRPSPACRGGTSKE